MIVYQGLSLNEESHSYPAKIFRSIEEEVRSLDWLVCDVESCEEPFPFMDGGAHWVSGDELYDALMTIPNLQWIWGTLSGFKKDVNKEEILPREAERFGGTRGPWILESSFEASLSWSEFGNRLLR